MYLAGLTGILFAHCSDVAYSAMRIYQAVGFTIGFAMAELLNFNSRLWVLLSAAVLAILCSMIIELTTQSKEDLLPCIYRRRTPRSSIANKLESGSATNANQEHENVEPTDQEQAGVHQNPMHIHSVYTEDADLVLCWIGQLIAWMVPTRTQMTSKNHKSIYVVMILVL